MLREVWSIEIARNPQLTEVPVFFQLVTLQAFLLEGNAGLRAAPQFPSITTLLGMTIVDNAALERFAFPALEYAGLISVTGNPSLVEVSLPALSGAGSVYTSGFSARWSTPRPTSKDHGQKPPGVVSHGREGARGRRRRASARRQTF
jgi:hypothetical protein